MLIFSNEKLKRARRLFVTFFRIGAFTFGGGYAMVPLIEREVVAERKWLRHEEVLDMFAIGQTAPGVIAINVSIFVGHRVAGILGAVAAVLGMVLPSLVFMSVVAMCFEQIKDNAWVGHAFSGVRAGVLVLILSAVQKLAKPLKATVFNFALGIAAFGAMVVLPKIFPAKSFVLWVLLAAACVGLLADVLARPAKKEEGHA